MAAAEATRLPLVAAWLEHIQEVVQVEHGTLIPEPEA